MFTCKSQIPRINCPCLRIPQSSSVIDPVIGTVNWTEIDPVIGTVTGTEIGPVIGPEIDPVIGTVMALRLGL